MPKPDFFLVWDWDLVPHILDKECQLLKEHSNKQDRNINLFPKANITEEENCNSRKNYQESSNIEKIM